MTRESAISRSTRHFDEGEFIEDLARRVAIRTESQVAESRAQLDVYVKDEIAPDFERMGFAVEILPNPAGEFGPILLAERIEDPTGEELSSPGLRAFCEQHRERLKADVLIASDGPRLAAKRPTVYLGSRGSLNMNFTVDLREGAHHSGNWGGLLANPGVILAHALASIVSREGRVLIRELLPERIPESVRAALTDCAPEPGEDEPAIDPRACR